ncbi:MAG: hypothetical protein WDM87_08335 [Terracidiphilus sp.]
MRKLAFPALLAIAVLAIPFAASAPNPGPGPGTAHHPCVASCLSSFALPTTKKIGLFRQTSPSLA